VAKSSTLLTTDGRERRKNLGVQTPPRERLTTAALEGSLTKVKFLETGGRENQNTIKLSKEGRKGGSYSCDLDLRDRKR